MARRSQHPEDETVRQSLNGEAELSFDDLAAELRALTAGRDHTPAEVLQREGRDER